jgi:hypothetical protein
MAIMDEMDSGKQNMPKTINVDKTVVASLSRNNGSNVRLHKSNNGTA